MNDHELPTLTMRDDALVPEGVYQAICTKLEMVNEEFLRFNFRLLDKSPENPFVDGICKVEARRTSQSIRWILALTGMDFEEGNDLDLQELQSQIVETQCFVKIKHREREGNVYANVVQVISQNDPRFT